MLSTRNQPNCIRVHVSCATRGQQGIFLVTVQCCSGSHVSELVVFDLIAAGKRHILHRYCFASVDADDSRRTINIT
jgi:hypothetical protein